MDEVFRIGVVNILEHQVGRWSCFSVVVQRLKVVVCVRVLYQRHILIQTEEELFAGECSDYDKRDGDGNDWNLGNWLKEHWHVVLLEDWTHNLLSSWLWILSLEAAEEKIVSFLLVA